MKILCLLVILANIFLLMWEYRSGAFTAHNEKPEQQTSYGQDQILLLHELKKQPHSLLPSPNQETQMDAPKSDGDIKEIHHNIESINKTANQAGYPQIQLP